MGVCCTRDGKSLLQRTICPLQSYKGMVSRTWNHVSDLNNQCEHRNDLRFSLSMPFSTLYTLLVVAVLGIYFGCTIQKRAAESLEKGIIVVNHLGESKVGQFHKERIKAGYQDIVRLDVAMSNATVVEVLQGMCDLPCNRPALQLIHFAICVHIFQQISVVHVLHHDEEICWLFSMIDVLDDVRLQVLIVSMWNEEIQTSLT